MSNISVITNSSLVAESDVSNEDVPIQCRSGHKLILPNEFYKNILASAVLSEPILNRSVKFKDKIKSLKSNLNFLNTVLKELKDIESLTASSMPAFTRNSCMNRNDQDEVSSNLLTMLYVHQLYMTWLGVGLSGSLIRANVVLMHASLDGSTLKCVIAFSLSPLLQLIIE